MNNWNISRRLTPTAVYKLQGLANEMRRKAKKNKKRYNPMDAASKLAARFKLDLKRVERILA